jgi:hypothetical protein
MHKKFEITKSHFTLVCVLLICIIVAVANGLKVIHLPDLPNWTTSALLALLAYLAGRLAYKLKSVSIWGLDLIILRGILVTASGLYPDQGPINEFLADGYVKLVWYFISILMVLMGLARVMVIAERYKEILLKTKFGIADMLIMVERFNLDNPGKVVFVPKGTKYIVMDETPEEIRAEEAEEVAHGDTIHGRVGPPLK